VFLVLDGNNLAWAGFHALRRPMGAETPAQKTRAALLGLAGSALNIIGRRGELTAPRRSSPLPPRRLERVAIAFDDGRPLRRRQVFPAYQTGREHTPAFMENEPFVTEAIRQFSEACRMLPIDIARGVNTEADDLAAALVLAQAGECPVRIVSTDRDFLQLVDEQVSVLSPVKRVVIDTANFSEATAPRNSGGWPIEFPRERYLDYRVASGDASDDLPGIPGVGPTTAARLLAFAPLEAYLDEPRLATKALDRQNRRVQEAFASGEAAVVVARNRQLMDLRLAARSYPDLEAYLSRGDYDEGGFTAWVEEQRFAGLDLQAALAGLREVAEGR
jgi:5'-3' exonuclease